MHLRAIIATLHANKNMPAIPTSKPSIATQLGALDLGGSAVRYGRIAWASNGGPRYTRLQTVTRDEIGTLTRTTCCPAALFKMPATGANMYEPLKRTSYVDR